MLINYRPFAATMSNKSIETLSSKIIRCSASLSWFFYFLDSADHSTYTTLNWGTRGIRELMLDANKIEQVRQYHKVSFPKSVSTNFVSKCRPPHDQGTFHKMMGYSFKNTRNGKNISKISKWQSLRPLVLKNEILWLTVKMF